MAFRKDPATGQMVDDGQPAAGAVPGVVPIFPPKPEYESETTQRIESPQSQSAAAQVAVASGAELNANEQAAGLAQQEDAAKGADAAAREKALQGLQTEQDRIEGDKQRFVATAADSDKTEIADMAAKRVRAGHASAEYWKGNAAGEVFAALLRGIDRAASSFRGESGPTGVDRIIDAKINAYERALVGEWEASKEAHEAAAQGRDKYLAGLTEKKLNAVNRSELELKMVGARLDKAMAALGPERAAALKAAADASAMKAQARFDTERAQLYEELHKVTNRSPTASAGSNRPLSTETRDIAAAAEEYKRLQARQTELLNKNGGKFPPLDSEDGQEFETNDKAMVTILQKPLGKSEGDADKAEGLQAAPGKSGVILQSLGRKQGVKNYKTSLRVNSDRLSKDAQTKLALEGRGNAPPAAAPPPPKKPPPKDGETVTFGGKSYRVRGGKLVEAR